MKLSFQLYSARNFTPWADVIARLGALGYEAAEGFGPLYEDPAATRAALDAAGLTMPTLHVSLDMAEGDTDALVALARTLGATAVYVPWIAPEARPTDAAGWAALADRLAACHARITAHGLTFGWHNHDFEFFPLPDGQIPMEILLTRAPQIDWEADLAWIVRGKADPLDWITRHGARITAAHFKDIAPAGEKTDEDGWADPGTGTVDWAALHRALKTQTRCAVLVAEHDNPSSFDRFATQAVATYRSF